MGVNPDANALWLLLGLAVSAVVGRLVYVGLAPPRTPKARPIEDAAYMRSVMDNPQGVVVGSGETHTVEVKSACRDCRHWSGTPEQRRPYDEYDEPVYAECRRHAPLGLPQAHTHNLPPRWPTTEAEQWCGDFEPLRAQEP